MRMATCCNTVWNLIIVVSQAIAQAGHQTSVQTGHKPRCIHYAKNHLKGRSLHIFTPNTYVNTETWKTKREAQRNTSKQFFDIQLIDPTK